MSSLQSWWSARVPVRADELRELTNEPVPGHLKRWWFALGGTPAYLFLVQIVTGILLAFYYQPAPSTAYESVDYITNQAAFGWYLRSLHKWAATLMIAAVILLSHEPTPPSFVFSFYFGGLHPSCVSAPTG